MLQLTARLILCASVLAAAAPDAELRSEKDYFLVSFRGRTIGKAQRVLISEQEGGRKILTLAVSEHFRFSTPGRPPAESRLQRMVSLKPDWTPVAISETSVANERTEKRSARIYPDRVVFTLAGGKERKVGFKGAIVAEMSGRVLAARGLLEVGRSFKAAVPDLAQSGLAVLQASVIGRKTVTGRKQDLFLVNVRVEGGNQEWDLLVDSRGRLIEQSQGDMVRRRVDAASAVLPSQPVALDSGSIPLQRAPDRFHNLKSMELYLEMPEAAGDLVPVLPGQLVKTTGRKIQIRLTERRPNGLLPPEKLGASERKAWLTPEDDPDWRDQEIKALAGKITGNEKSALRKGYLIGRWVYRNLTKSLGGPPNASATQALAARSGDCSEHAALFAALCRASEIPARVVYGLAAARGSLRFHVWNEYYAGGVWVPLDTALGRYGLPACYITLSYNREDGGQRLFKLYAAARGRVTDYEVRKK